jgi:hypothetical protein
LATTWLLAGLAAIRVAVVVVVVVVVVLTRAWP